MAKKIKTIIKINIPAGAARLPSLVAQAMEAMEGEQIDG